MKDKNAAGILALFLGWLGIHRFYLGQAGLGVLYLVFCWFPLIWLVAFVDAIVLLSMDQQRFDEKFNRKRDFALRPNHPDFERDAYVDNRHKQTTQQKKTQAHTPVVPPVTRANPHKQSGLEKFKDFDYAGAIEDFNKSLEIAPQDIATHFNLACVYSLTEVADKAFYHLDKAVALGFRDFQKIKEHHALAFLRIQKDYDNFEENGFRLSLDNKKADARPNLLESRPDLLDQLKKLASLREQGLLTEQEFVDQKKRLLG